ncbi:MAG TPA: class I SAM-dependent methyltransferase [Stellaceae bacterium]|nr:class I SAM-dependent methyltransferase [Stellaceae bacterium]
MIESFSLDWLRLREPHDLRARSRALARQFCSAVRARAGREIASVIDLGAGSGANFRALAPLVAGDQEWRLVDQDRTLLAHQSAEIAQWARGQGWRVTHGSGVVTVATGTAHWRAHSVALDLAHELAEVLLAVHGVACAALLDLVSAPWLEALADRVAATRAPFLAALSVDGRRDWQPPHFDDAPVARAFARHQRGDKGFGPALGPDAAAMGQRLFRERGYRVTTAAGEWRLGAGDDAVLAALIDGTAEAAGEAEPALALARWRGDRHAERQRGGLRLAIGHVDILAEPDESPAART